MSSPPLHDRCLAMALVNYTNFGFSLFILIGILVSYLPQHIRIINRRSSFGLSPYFVLLGTISGTCQFANILTLPSSRADMACCHKAEVDGFACFAGMLGIAQVGMQWLCFVAILILFLIFFPRATPAEPDPAKITDEQPSFRTAIAVAAACVVHAVITLILSLYLILAQPDHLSGWANFLGIFSTILACIQYFPQIWTTYVLKRVASLSIPMMCIQTPGAFVWAASLGARYGGSGWSAWGVYVVTGCLQGTLLVMGIIFERRHRRQEREEAEARATDSSETPRNVSERTPLLEPE